MPEPGGIAEQNLTIGKVQHWLNMLEIIFSAFVGFKRNMFHYPSTLMKLSGTAKTHSSAHVATNGIAVSMYFRNMRHQ